MLSASAESMSESLYQYGEHEAADWVGSCSDDELVRVCATGGLSEWLRRRVRPPCLLGRLSGQVPIGCSVPSQGGYALRPD